MVIATLTRLPSSSHFPSSWNSFQTTSTQIHFCRSPREKDTAFASFKSQFEHLDDYMDSRRCRLAAGEPQGCKQGTGNIEVSREMEILSFTGGKES